MSASASSETSQKQLVIIDTDVSTDGALALLLALTTSDCEVLAITIEKGRWGVNESCDNILRILAYFGRPEIPVYRGLHPGVKLPQRVFKDEKFVCNFPAGLLPPAPGDVEDEFAHEVLNRLAKQHKGNVSLVTLGPLTNLGLASRYGSTICHNLKHVYVSAGEKRILEGGNSNANFYGDSLSAQQVLDEFSCPITIVTWEVSEASYMSWDWFTDWINGDDDASWFMRVCTRHYLNCHPLMSEWPGFRSCGLLTMTAMLRPSLVTRRKSCSVTVVPRNPRTRGMLVPGAEVGRKRTFVVEFDVDAVRKFWEGMPGSID